MRSLGRETDRADRANGTALTRACSFTGRHGAPRDGAKAAGGVVPACNIRDQEAQRGEEQSTKKRAQALSLARTSTTVTLSAIMTTDGHQLPLRTVCAITHDPTETRPRL